MAGKLHAECRRFDIQFDCTEYERLDIKLGGGTVRINPGYILLNERQPQIIVPEVKFGNYVWCVIGIVRNAAWPSKERTTYSMLLYVHLQPSLNDEESAALKVSYTHSDVICEIKTFEIGPPKTNYRYSSYGPYAIKIEIPSGAGISDFGKLTLTFGIGKSGDPNGISFSEKPPNPTSGNNLLEYLKQLFQSHELSDVTLKIRGKEFPAHKVLLCSSPVFKAMFLNDFRESRSNVIEIKDFEFEVIREMLKFIYTHKPPQFRSPEGNIDTVSLYKAAHKYEIQYLLESCREELLSTFNIKNALDVLLLSDMYDDALLKEEVLDFICKNPPSVADVSKCGEVVRQRPELLQDILTCKFKHK